MRTKNFNKKLSLNKKTITNLKESDMNALHGGLAYTRWPMKSCKWCGVSNQGDSCNHC